MCNYCFGTPNSLFIPADKLENAGVYFVLATMKCGIMSEFLLDNGSRNGEKLPGERLLPIYL